MKEINFTKFIELKDKLFSFSKNGNNNNDKILINPFFEFVINTLVEDIKLFSLGCFIKEKNENKKNKNTNTNDLSQILNKKDLSKFEIEFCIIFGILCERLKYYKIALKYYLKALNFCFSKYSHK